MNFLQESFTVKLADLNTKGLSFVADVSAERPPFIEIFAYAGWAAELKDTINLSLTRARCPLKTVDIVADMRGFMIIVTFHETQSLGNAKFGVKATFGTCLVQWQNAMVSTLRPLDELDQKRLDTMQLAHKLRGCVPQAREDGPVEDIFCIPDKRNWDPKFRSVEAYCLAIFEEEQLELNLLADDERAHPLYLNDTAACTGTVAVRRARSDWVELAQNVAPISILSVGTCDLFYIHCHRESRRVLLLASAVRSDSTLSDVCQIAATMAEAGSLPRPTQNRLVKAEFIKRCIDVLKSKNPSAECDIKKLTRKEQRNISVAVGGNVSGCEDCPEPAELDFHWDQNLLCWSRQSYRASTPTNSLPETLALCKRCDSKNPWSCTRCRRRDTFEACRSTRYIPHPALKLEREHGDCFLFINM